ncbi:MAG: aminotransferase class V-fold PLP-dependent enzyme [Phycisphaerales bacterium]
MSTTTHREVSIDDAIAALGDRPLDEHAIRTHLWPLFSRVVAQREQTGLIYLANHSLGRPLDRTARDVEHALDLWYRDLDRAWGPWSDMIGRYRALNARLIGCARHDAVVHKVSAGQGLRTVLNTIEPKSRRPRVLTTRGEFDACDFILKRYAAKGRIDLDWVEPDDRSRFDADDIASRITREHDLVVVSTVFFSTGQWLDRVQTVIDAAHQHGAMILLDTYHQAGVIPMQFDASRADFAIGGNYKYTRGGPGACWLAVRSDHLDDPRLAPIDTGWFAKADHFGFGREDDAPLAPGGDGWQEGTPALLSMVQALAGLEFTLAVGVERLRAYSLEQQAFFADRLRAAGAEVIDDPPRGAFLLVPAAEPGTTAAALAQRGIITDGRLDPRGRGHVRFCPDLLTTREELERAAPIIAEVTRRP